MSSYIPIKRALISVSDKTGVVELAKVLHDLDIEIISTGGTAKLLQEHHIPHREISDYTHFPEIFDGRIKTLHPIIYGGILARRDIDKEVMEQLQIPPIDLVIVNLYPFEQTVAKKDCHMQEAIENIDIGGPTLLRAAAKNFNFVTVVVNTQDYPLLIKELTDNKCHTTTTTRFQLAKKAFAHTARYDGVITNYLTSMTSEGEVLNFPEVFCKQFIKKQDLRYGENPHQKAIFYEDDKANSGTITKSQLLQGKPLSFNNIADADTALECVRQLTGESCVIVKHANPCGVASTSHQLLAYEKAYQTDPVSAFGGIIAFNTALTPATAEKILQQQFVEVIIAPDFPEATRTILNTKPNVRVLKYQPVTTTDAYDYKCVTGGLLIQELDSVKFDDAQFEVVTKRVPTAQEYADLLFAWHVVKLVKSNAIVLAKNTCTIGIGAGQMSRVFSVKIALLKAKEANLSTRGSVLASDAFFPFRDGVDQAAKEDITAIIQPGGSLRDTEVIQAADEANLAMILTNTRHFRH